MVGIDHVAEEVDTLLDGSDPVVGFHFQPDGFDASMHRIAHGPQLRFRGGQHAAVVAVAIVVADAEAILEFVVEVDRED